MPIYEYECEKCGRFETIQKMSDAPLAKCETCGKPVQKLVSQSSFALKGGGWYKDLYSSTKKDSGGSSESSSKDSKSASAA
ncbi:MAG: FmdB family zinc ribbon protein [Myxococcales bacterium]